MAGSQPSKARYCTLHEYKHAWEVGTGLPVSLEPGRYRITGEEQLNGVRFVRLEQRYRVEADTLGE